MTFAQGALIPDNTTQHTFTPFHFTGPTVPYSPKRRSPLQANELQK